MMRVLDTGVSTAQRNMDLDQVLLDQMKPSDDPLLHFYDWDGPSATYGYFIDPGEYFRKDLSGISLGRRPTGGGIVFHIWDFAFSFLMPAAHPYCSDSALENYQYVNQKVLSALKTLFSYEEASLITEDFSCVTQQARVFCMARPTKYDVLFEGKKLVGAAQRRKKQGYLHQGTISLAHPDYQVLKAALSSEEQVVQAMQQYTHAPLGTIEHMNVLQEARKEVQAALQREFI